MPEQRRRFSPQFKAEAVQLVIETGKPIAEAARGLGIHDGTLGNWVNAWRCEHPGPVPFRRRSSSTSGRTRPRTWVGATLLSCKARPSRSSLAAMVLHPPRRASSDHRLIAD